MRRFYQWSSLTFRVLISMEKVFEIDDAKAWKSVLTSVTSYALGIFMIAKAPWYLLPLAWAWTGTAITGVSFVNFEHFTVLCWLRLKNSWLRLKNSQAIAFDVFNLQTSTVFLISVFPCCIVLCHRTWLCAQIILKEQAGGRHRWNAGIFAPHLSLWAMALQARQASCKNKHVCTIFLETFPLHWNF